MLYIRTDMNSEIATGHVMRCLSIADAVRDLGEKVLFVLSDESGAAMISGRGFETFVLHSDWRDLGDGTGAVLQMVHEEDAVLVDSYSKSYDFMAAVREKAYVMYLDDLNAETHPVDGLLCYAPYYTEFDYPAAYPGADLLLGTEYAPLRAEYALCAAKKISDRIRTILILSGGSDSYGAVPKILKSFMPSPYESVYAVCGMYSSCYDALRLEYADCGGVHILKSVPNLKDYIESADLVITAGGSTLYELCAVGTPAISYSFADNQLLNVQSFAGQGIIPYAGDFRQDDVTDRLHAELGKLEDAAVRRAVSERMQRMVDGKGAQRIAAFICGKCGRRRTF